jgi:transcriptional/translational regulatory protein YebC/TACO1
MGRAHEVRKQSMEKTAAMKSAIYGRAAKEIYMAAKNGSDPSANLALMTSLKKTKTLLFTEPSNHLTWLKKR